MLRIHKPKFPEINWCVYRANSGKPRTQKLPNGFEFRAFEYCDNAVIKGYINSTEYIIISIYDCCWCGKHPIPRDIIKENIPIFTNS